MNPYVEDMNGMLPIHIIVDQLINYDFKNEHILRYVPEFTTLKYLLTKNKGTFENIAKYYRNHNQLTKKIIPYYQKYKKIFDVIINEIKNNNKITESIKNNLSNDFYCGINLLTNKEKENMFAEVLHDDILIFVWNGNESVEIRKYHCQKIMDNKNNIKKWNCKYINEDVVQCKEKQFKKINHQKMVNDYLNSIFNIYFLNT